MPGRIRLGSLPNAQRSMLTAPGDWPACNPSIANDGDGFRVIIRTIDYRLRENGHWLSHPPGGARTVNWLVRLDRNLKTISASRIADEDLTASDPRARNGLEDARPFYWRSNWWFVAAGMRYIADDVFTTTCICRFDDTSRVAEAHFIESPLGQGKEKNWMPVVDGDALKLIYRISPLQIVDVDNERRGSLRSLDERSFRTDGWSGSSQLVAYRNGWLCVVHNRIYTNECLYYEHAFVELSRDFRILRVSRPWYFDEQTVEFCAGLCISDGSAILSYGHMDREARLLKLPLSIVEALLENSWRSRLRLWLASILGAAV